jgi:hypothetical protein
MTTTPVASRLSTATADPALGLLLASKEPAVRHAALVRLLDRPATDPDVVAARKAIGSGPIVAGLLADQRPDGGFGSHPYAKWGGAHWRLVSLVDLDIPPDTDGAREAAGTVLDWLTADAHVRRVPVIEGRARRCASQEGNALWVATYLGLTDDARLRLLASNLVEWQWPDGGWNCDRHRSAHHSSFNESLPPLIGLSAYASATGDSSAATPAERVAEFVLEHRVMYSHTTGEIANRAVTRLCYPPYWHYDALAALKGLVTAGRIGDPRASDALDFLESRRHEDGTWHADHFHWARPGRTGSNVEVVDWGRRGPSEGLTLGALKVLKAAGRWAPPSA